MHDCKPVNPLPLTIIFNCNTDMIRQYNSVIGGLSGQGLSGLHGV